MKTFNIFSFCEKKKSFQVRTTDFSPDPTPLPFKSDGDAHQGGSEAIIIYRESGLFQDGCN